MSIRKLRTQRGWTQDQLATLSGLNVRTIQRIEKSQSASVESLKSLSAVFEIPIGELKKELGMLEQAISNNTQIPTNDDVQKHVKDLRDFYQHLITFICVGGIMLILDLLTSPGHMWSKWPVFGWAIGVLIHALSVFLEDDFLGESWIRRQVKKRRQ